MRNLTLLQSGHILANGEWAMNSLPHRSQEFLYSRGGTWFGLPSKVFMDLLDTGSESYLALIRFADGIHGLLVHPAIAAHVGDKLGGA